MNHMRSTSRIARATATGFALAMLSLSADGVMCIGADGHLAIERGRAACCAGGVPGASSSAAPSGSAVSADLNECADCSDYELTATFGAATTEPSGLSTPSGIFGISLLPPARATSAAARSFPAQPVLHRRASLEFARVISLRC